MATLIKLSVLLTSGLFFSRGEESTTRLPVLSVICDFDDAPPNHACGFGSVNGSLPWSWTNSTTPSLFTGPTGDLTQTGVKGYVYIEASGRRLGDEFRLRSPLIAGTPASPSPFICLSFSTHMMGENIGSLRVEMVSSVNGGVTSLYIRRGDRDNYWETVKLAYETDGDHYIDFVGVNGKDHLGDIAVDGVNIAPCDGTGHHIVQDAAFEEPMPQPMPVTLPFKCNFDSNRCGFINSQSDDADMLRVSGPTESDFTGPTADHTTGYNAGHYVYLEASAPASGTARLLSPVFTVPADKQVCMTFYYHMYGAGMGTLSVTSRDDSDNLLELLRISGNQGDQWLRGQAKTSTGGTFKFEFDATVGNDFRSDIALDDVHVFECQEPVTWPEPEPEPELPYPDGCKAPVSVQGASGYFASDRHFPNAQYRPNQKCRWTVTASDNQKVLQLNYHPEFFVESSERCEHDYVRVFVGLTSDQLNSFNPCGKTDIPFKGPYCGSYAPEVYTAPTGKVTVEFCSDHRNHLAGFRIDWQEITKPVAPQATPSCSGKIELKSGEREFIRIPARYEDLYYNNSLLCEYEITNPEAKGSVVINTGLFEVEQSNGCQFDYLEIEEPCVAGSPKQRFCGYNGPVHYRSSCSGVKVRFVSDSNDYKKGIHLVAQGEACTAGQFSCGNGVCINRKDICDGTRHCPNGEDEDQTMCTNFLSCGLDYPFPVQYPQAPTTTSSWHVAILSKTRRISCSGTLIGSNWLLTSAQCVQGMRPDEMVIRLDAPIVNFDMWPTSTEVTPERIIVHPDFNNILSIENDIAIVKFRVPTGSYVPRNPVCLPNNDNFIKSGVHLLASGYLWNQMNEVSGGTPPEPDRNITIVASTMSVNVLSDDQCRAMGGYGMSQSTICTTPWNCEIEGDLGAPLVYERNGVKYLAGIYSFSSSECRDTVTDDEPTPFTPGIYTRLQSFRTWILDVIARDAFTSPIP